MRTTDAILAILPTYPDSMSASEIGSYLSLESRDVSARLWKLRNQGKVVQVPGSVRPCFGGSLVTWAKPAVVEEVNP